MWGHYTESVQKWRGQVKVGGNYTLLPPFRFLIVLIKNDLISIHIDRLWLNFSHALMEPIYTTESEMEIVGGCGRGLRSGAPLSHISRILIQNVIATTIIIKFWLNFLWALKRLVCRVIPKIERIGDGWRGLPFHNTERPPCRYPGYLI